jgi:hypothetical protein
MAQAVRCIDGPLDGEVFIMRGAPPVLYVRRTVSADGVAYVPDPHEAPEILRAGRYRKAIAPNSAGQFLYRFEQ